MRSERGPINYFANTQIEQSRIREARDEAILTMRQYYPHEPYGSKRMRRGIAAFQLVNLYDTSGKYTEEEIQIKEEKAGAKVIELFRRR